MFVGTIHAFCLDLLTSEVPEFMKYEVLNEAPPPATGARGLTCNRSCRRVSSSQRREDQGA